MKNDAVWVSSLQQIYSSIPKRQICNSNCQALNCSYTQQLAEGLQVKPTIREIICSWAYRLASLELTSSSQSADQGRDSR